MNMMQVIRRGAYGISDDQLNFEHRIQNRLFAAIAELDAAIQDAEAGSVCADFTGARTALEDMVHDYIPSRKTWDEAIDRARNP